MNNQDLTILLQFAKLSLQYFAEEDEYQSTQLWQHLENTREIRRQANKLIPFVASILDHEQYSKTQ